MMRGTAFSVPSNKRFALRKQKRAELQPRPGWSCLMPYLKASPIEQAAASFGDAAASYFALLDDSEPGVNLDALGQSKALGAKVGSDEANRPGDAKGLPSDAPCGDARDKQ